MADGMLSDAVCYVASYPDSPKWQRVRLPSRDLFELRRAPPRCREKPGPRLNHRRGSLRNSARSSASRASAILSSTNGDSPRACRAFSSSIAFVTSIKRPPISSRGPKLSKLLTLKSQSY